jgi:hypothetical protein
MCVHFISRTIVADICIVYYYLVLLRSQYSVEYHVICYFYVWLYLENLFHYSFYLHW